MVLQRGDEECFFGVDGVTVTDDDDDERDEEEKLEVELPLDVVREGLARRKTLDIWEGKW